MNDPEHSEEILIRRYLAQRFTQRHMQRHPARLAIELMQALASRDPEPASSIFAARFDLIGGQARRNRWIVRIAADFSGRWIQAVEAFATRQPQGSRAVLADVSRVANWVVNEP